MTAGIDYRDDVFNRTDDERKRAYAMLAARNPDGQFEVSVCADCGWWGIWDSDLHEGVRCGHPSGRHLITRVIVRPVPPRDGGQR